MRSKVKHALEAVRWRPPSLDHSIYSVLLIVAIGVFLLSTMRAGNEWDGDDALYIMNARNIVLGMPYGKTDYIMNPANPINPAAYPPGLPLMLAPIYWLFGINLVKMKALCIVCFTMFLAVFVRIAREHVPAGLALATVAALGLHPFIWQFKDSLLGELPFMLPCYGSLFLVDRLQRATDSTSARTVAAAGIAVAFAYLIRAIGIVIFAAAFFSSLVNCKRVLNTTVGALVTAAIIVLAVQKVFPPDIGTYVRYFHSFSPYSVFLGVAHYARVWPSLVGQPVLRIPILAALIGLAFAALVILGFIVQVRRRISVFEWFFVGYALFLLLYPVTLEVSRYSLPLWPLLFLYCAGGISAVMRPLGGNARRAFAIAVGVVTVGLYVTQYATLDIGPIQHSIDTQQSLALFAAIRREVPRDAGILARKPTVIALFGQRRAMIWGESFDDKDLWTYMAQQGVQYIVQERFQVIEAKEDQNALLNGFILRNKSALTPVFTNDWFVLYRVR